MRAWIRANLYWGGSLEWGVWSIRVCNHVVQLKAPHNRPLFSERYGYKKTLLTVRGWRLLYDGRKC